MRLTDWITQAVEMHMQPTRVAIPDDLEFADLQLAREADGSVSFDWSVIERICAASGLSASLFRDAPEDNVSGLIVGWYRAHKKDGGNPDPVAEDLIAEARAEDAAGQQFSHEPGRA